MGSGKIKISGTGCALADFLYTGIRFDSQQFVKYLSKKSGDGGLSPGKLVFIEELEKFCLKPYDMIFEELSGGAPHDAFNIGGPGLVSMINTAQLLDKDSFEVSFFGGTGDDEIAVLVNKMVQKTPLNIDNYRIISNKRTPFTDVLSDPTFNNNQGERTFINNIGAAWDYSPDLLNEGFFNSRIVCFGGTALVPQIHDNLTALLAKAKKNGCITVVNTVFDFRNEKSNPDKPWPLVDDPDNFRLIDLLIMDCEESLKISGRKSITEAAVFFIEKGVPAFIITNGANDLYAFSNGKMFKNTDLRKFPVSKKVSEHLASNPASKVDTTGCGDNFAGGVISSLAMQLKYYEARELNFEEAIAWGVASGGFACFYLGGTFLENSIGEKLKLVEVFKNEYINQISSNNGGVKKKMVLFGAGKIGRSFIGQLFSRGGYQVVFIDLNKAVIEELNNRRNYNVIIKSDKELTISIKNVSGVFALDEQKVFDEVASAGIIAISVGLNGLSSVIKLIAQGLIKRYSLNEAAPLDIIIAENLRNAADFVRSELRLLLPSDFPLEERIGLIETSIGKMVPIMTEQDMKEDILQVFAEPYNTLILDSLAFKNPIPEIEGLSPKENMKAWVDRKLFIHNLGHSATAYIGYLYNPEFIYLYEALAVDEVYKKAKAAMQQAADVLLKMYPEEFTKESLNEHIDDLLLRFQNRALGDTIYRVGCDLLRKLSIHDRITGAIMEAMKYSLPYENILFALVCGLHFRAKDESGNMFLQDIEFARMFSEGISSVLTSVCGFDENSDKDVFRNALEIENSLKLIYRNY